jgi:hypothetical protein
MASQTSHQFPGQNLTEFSTDTELEGAADFQGSSTEGGLKPYVKKNVTAGPIRCTLLHGVFSRVSGFARGFRRSSSRPEDTTH